MSLASIRARVEKATEGLERGGLTVSGQRARVALALSAGTAIPALLKVAEAAQLIREYESFEMNFGQIGKDLDDALAEIEAME